MSKYPLQPAALMLCGLSTISLADSGHYQLQDQLITASRTAQTVEQSLAAVTVFDRAQIEQSQASSVPELLQKVPGVSLTNNGGPGKSTSVFIRGSNANHILVLIDGIKVGSVTSGSAAFQDLPIELIERIEVVRGPRSSLYGSEAIGGVIQIFTRRGQGQGAKPFFSAGVGSHNSYNGSAGISGGNGAGWYSLGVSSNDTDGINVKARDASGYEPDRDGYRNLSASLRGGYRFASGLELDANLLQAKSHNDYDSVNRRGTAGFGAHSDGLSKVAGLRARFAPLEPWQVSLQAGRSEDKSDAFTDGQFSSRFDSRRDSLSWQNELSLGEGHALVLGLDHQRDQVSGSTAYAEDSRDNMGHFVQYLGNAGRHDWQLALRRDDDQQFGRQHTGSLAYGFAWSEALRSTLSYGTAFKAPTFNQLYFPGFGNPDLQAETSKSLELGLNGRHAWGHWALNAYRSQIDNLISTVRVNGQSQAQGVDTARIRGVELVLGSALLGWDWQANYSLMSTENRSKRLAPDGQPFYGRELNRRPGQMLNLDIDRRFADLSLGASLHVQESTYDDLANQVELDGFVTLDLRAEYRLSPQWRLQGRVSNLLDAQYQTADGFNQMGRALQLSLRYQAL
jgi:vitamin B12 transporter